VLCWLIWLTPALAADPGSAWYRRVWQTEEGLPAANVTGIAQTRDGYLWLGTQNGLARFDGVQFEEVPARPGHAHPIIRVMLCDHAENFWLAEYDGVVVRFSAGAAQVFTTADGLPEAQPLQMVETPDNDIWITYADGSVFRINPASQVVRLRPADGLPEDGTCSLTVDARGVLWFDKGAQFGFFHDRHFEITGTLNERNAQILSALDGGIWLCTSSQLFILQSNAAPVVVAGFGGGLRVKPSALFEDAPGRLWIGTTADGLFLYDQNHLSKIETSQNNIRAITSDREGSIWVGTDGGGLNRMRLRSVDLHGPDEGSPFETVRSLCEDDAGGFWIVSQDGGLIRLPGGSWDNAQRVADWPGGQAHCVVADRQGAIWIGTYLRGLYRWKDGVFTHFTAQNGLGGRTIRSLLVDRHNDLWLGLEAEHLVQRFHAGSFQTFKQPPNSRAVRAMTEDAAGIVWMGTLDGELLRVDGDHLSEAPPPDSIRCLGTTPDGSLWIGYSVNGLGRWKDGKFSRIGLENGLFDANICALMPDAADRMWFASDRGIFFVSLRQLNACAEGQTSTVSSIFFGRDAGLPSLQAYYGYWPGALRTRAGEIWFPTHSGVAVVYPDRVQANRQPPNVLIQSFAVDGREMLKGKNAGATPLPPGHRRIEVTFSAPSFIAPEQVRFRYRLAGWSDDWSEAGGTRTAVFSRLPPGDYTFEVTACNNFGVWNDRGAVLPFTVAPFFWQSWWFRLLAVLVFMASVMVLARYLSHRRVRLILKKVEQETALQAERTRIAQDMHDELGARFTQISLLGELTRNAMNEPDQAREFMGQISRVAQVGVKSLDEIVWAVNPRNDTLPDLLDYTGQYALDFVAAAGLHCRLDFPDEPPAEEVAGNIRHAMFLMIKETLNNVVKHARATRVKIIFELNGTEMFWRIEDDGRGFEQAPDNALADGLRNLRQRAAALGGMAEIKSRPGAGTWVTFKIPLRKAGKQS